jgi:hypothetical protein
MLNNTFRESEDKRFDELIHNGVIFIENANQERGIVNDLIKSFLHDSQRRLVEEIKKLESVGEHTGCVFIKDIEFFINQTLK